MRTCLALLAGLTALLPAQEPTRLVGKPAPEWRAVRPDGRPPVGPRDLCGDVVVVAQGRSDPDGLAADVAALAGLLRAAGDVRLLLVAPGEPSVGRAAADALATAGAGPPIGIVETAIAADYDAPDAPWVAVHDRRGLLRHVGPLGEPERLADAIAAAKSERRPNPLVGQLLDPPPAPTASTEADVRPSPLELPAGGELFLLRWWTVGCPFCRASLPDLEDLCERHPGLVLVPVFHQKGPTRPSDVDLRSYLDELGVETGTRRDPDWQRLRPLMRRAALTRATSVSFLVDRDRVVRWVHAGPRLHRDPTGEHPDAERDLVELEALVTRWLGPGDGAGHEDGRDR